MVNRGEDTIPIVDLANQTIAGVRVSFRDLRNDLAAQRNIEEALSKLQLNFEYVIKKPNVKKEEG